jgi:hypothetical protein
MSRTISIDVACDHCGDSLDEDHAIVTPLKFGKKEGLVDLCPPCLEAWETDLESLFNNMRPATEPVEFKCPHCPKITPTKQGLGIHIVRIHKELT